MEDYLELFKKYVNKIESDNEIRFPLLLKEWIDFKPVIPKFNSDEYWDYRCREAKYELHKKINAWHFTEMVKDIMHDWDWAPYLKERVTHDDGSMSITRTYHIGIDPY